MSLVHNPQQYLCSPDWLSHLILTYNSVVELSAGVATMKQNKNERTRKVHRNCNNTAAICFDFIALACSKEKS